MNNPPCTACGTVPPRSPCLAVATQDGRTIALCSACRWIARPGVAPWRMVAVGQTLLGVPVTVEIPTREARAVDAGIGRRRPAPLMVAQFIADRCTKRDGASVAVGDMREAYVMHAHRTERQPIPRHAWLRAMREAGYPSEKVGGYMVIRGLALKDADEPVAHF